jgi:hypothetical protein
MDKQEFAAWQAITERSRFHWIEDEVYRLNGRGAMYYIGGEDGTYLRIGSDGLLDVGTYIGAVPHIGEALFRSVRREQFECYADAFAAAIRLGDKRFLVEMFSGSRSETNRDMCQGPQVAKEKPSTLEQIHEAKKNLAPHTSKAERGGKEPEL